MTAVPTLGWPVKGSSLPGVKIRTRASPPASGGSTNVVSDRFISRAMACISSSAETVGLREHGERVALVGLVGEHVDLDKR